MPERVRAIIIENNKILLMHRVKDGHEYWVFPGGGMEETDVSPEMALERECLEELGVKVIVKDLFFEEPSLDQKSFGQLQFYYICEIVSGEVGTGQGPEFNRDVKQYGTYQVQWLPIKEIKDKIVYPLSVRNKIISNLK